MGNVANKCSDMELNKMQGLGAPKPLDASSSEGDDDELGDEDEEDEEEDNDDAKLQAEKALAESLKRGKTTAFKEAIDYATSLGIDETKITMAEQKLEEHKNFRRKEAFEGELADFMDSDEANDIEACQDKLKTGKSYGCTEKTLKALMARIEELDKGKALSPAEVARIREYFEVATRKFVATCMMGRDALFFDISSGAKSKATVMLDAPLKNLKVVGVGEEDMILKVSSAAARRAMDVDEVVGAGKFTDLKEEDQENAVAIVGAGSTWVFIEDTRAKQDEYVCGLTVLNPNGLSNAPNAATKGLQSPSGNPPSPRKQARKSQGGKAAPAPEPEPAEDYALDEEEEEAEDE
eukprot:gnl/TRDRNA2_/TRDRNA2_188324_c0_seq1.p1 gnl/TRDRNA2_/TRDRNA2_188324_c0~~gnl/TRDRNA2_/TRDRNA2_188324_c0_seq1.p1  ORF type:complete len:351 (+),score=111.02 gnl/TRDRNA2_/TRDRNA2_188324_c0_seq1:247-1299(+)